MHAASASEQVWTLRCSKKCAAVAPSTLPCQNVKGTPFSEHFSKKVQAVVEKHVRKSKMVKADGLAPLLDVEMSKKCTALWREAHLEVKIVKHTTFGPLLDVDPSVFVAGARGSAPCQK